MPTVKFTIPELAGTFTNLTPKLYAYFWGDIHTLGTDVPVSVSVPPSVDTRDAYPDFTQALVAVPIPAGFGSFQVNLDDGGVGIDAAGVLALVFGQHDTPDDAISAGYTAFGTAVSQQLNAYVQTNGAVAPTPAQIQAMAASIRADVSGAIKNKLSDWDKFLTWIGQETQDEFIGYSYAFFGPGKLTPPQDSALDLPPIVNQIQYSFPYATLEVQSGDAGDPCQTLVVAVNQAMTAVTDLMDQLHQLQAEYASATPAEKAALKIDMKEIQNTELPAAKESLAGAQAALQRCRALNGLLRVSNVVARPPARNAEEPKDRTSS
jgi:hypothetical protein